MSLLSKAFPRIYIDISNFEENCLVHYRSSERKYERQNTANRIELIETVEMLIFLWYICVLFVSIQLYRLSLHERHVPRWKNNMFVQRKWKEVNLISVNIKIITAWLKWWRLRSKHPKSVHPELLVKVFA